MSLAVSCELATAQSLTTARNKIRAQGPENARQFASRQGGKQLLHISSLVDGGGGSHQRTRLSWVISLLSGKIQGISAASAQGHGIRPVFCSRNQLVTAKFPERVRGNFLAITGNHSERCREGSLFDA